LGDMVNLWASVLIYEKCIKYILKYFELMIIEVYDIKCVHLYLF